MLLLMVDLHDDDVTFGRGKNSKKTKNSTIFFSEKGFLGPAFKTARPKISI